jgi:hypothetical protein
VSGASFHGATVRPSICSGCGHPWRAEQHVHGQTKCCPDCDHTEPSSGCFICRPEDASFRDVEGCPACEADFGNYVRSLYEAGVLADAE